MYYARLLVEHGINARSNDLQYQYIVFSVRAMHSEVIQESDDAFGSRVRPWLEREMAMDLNFVVPASELCDCKLEGNVSAILKY